MADRVDIVVTVDGSPVPLCVEVATMVLALVDHQQNIHKQGGGEVAFHYQRTDVTIVLSRLNYRSKVRPLILR